MKSKRAEIEDTGIRGGFTPGSPLALLPPDARARINATCAAATQQLAEGIYDFLMVMKDHGEKKLGHRPGSDDLLPHFQRYANLMYDAEIQERLRASTVVGKEPGPQSATDLVARAIRKAVLNRVVEQVCRKNGTWHRLVRSGSASVNLGLWQSPFGAYDRGAFMHPCRGQLKARLRVYALRSVHESWNRTAMDLRTKPTIRKQTKSNPPDGQPYPQRGAWLRERLRERNSTPYRLKTRCREAPDVRTIKKIRDGLAVREEGVLNKLATALSTYKRFPAVTEDQIPNN
jgi:hypothetical protein